MKKHFLSIALVVSGALSTSAAHAEFYYDFYGSATRVENITNSGDTSSEQSDTRTSLTGVAGYKFKPSTKTVLDTRLQYTSNTHTEFTLLDSQQIELDANLRHFLTKATWWRAALDVGVVDYEDDNRDSSLGGLALSLGTQLNKQWSIEGGYRYGTRDADAEAFSSDTHTIFGDTVWTVSDALYLYGKVELGTTEITTIAPNGSITEFNEVFVDDEAFGTGTSAYLLDADLASAEVGGSIKLAENMGFNIGYAYQRYDVDALDESVVDGVWKFSVQLRK